MIRLLVSLQIYITIAATMILMMVVTGTPWIGVENPQMIGETEIWTAVTGIIVIGTGITVNHRSASRIEIVNVIVMIRITHPNEGGTHLLMCAMVQIWIP